VLVKPAISLASSAACSTFSPAGGVKENIDREGFDKLVPRAGFTRSSTIVGDKKSHVFIEYEVQVAVEETVSPP